MYTCDDKNALDGTPQHTNNALAALAKLSLFIRVKHVRHIYPALSKGRQAKRVLNVARQNNSQWNPLSCFCFIITTIWHENIPYIPADTGVAQHCILR